MDNEADSRALAWMIRLRDPAFADWDALTGWLEEDAGNNARLEAALALDGAAGLLGQVGPRRATPGVTARAGFAPRRAALACAAIAAGVVGIWAGVNGWAGPGAGGATAPTIAVIETRAGERRTVGLPDGTEIALNGATRLERSSAAPRRVVLARGEANFTVSHDAAHPFEVVVGNRVVRDVGTRFDVALGQAGTRVAVAQGAVLFDPAGVAVRLDAGRTLLASGQAGAPVVGRVAPGDVAAWRDGRLVYADAPIAEVADGLSRQLGVPVSVAGGLGGRRFSGAIMTLDERPDLLMPRVAVLLGVRLAREGGGWRLTPEHAPRD